MAEIPTQKKWTAEKQARRVLRRKLRKEGVIPPAEPRLPGSQAPYKHANDISALIDESTTDPFARIQQLAEACGLPKSTTQNLMQRIRARWKPVQEGLLQVKTKQLQDLIDDRVHRALIYLDDSVLAAAGAKDLAVAIGILLEKRALLRGEPTQILSMEERRGMNDLVGAALEEAQRRGITIDVDPVTGSVRAIGGRPKRLVHLPAETTGEMV